MDDIDSEFYFSVIDSNSYLDFTLFEPQFDAQITIYTPASTQKSINGSNQYKANHQQKSNKRNRVDNNIFKTPLSVFRKVLKKFFKQKKIQCQFFEIINKEKRNFSTFPKYWLICMKKNVKEKLVELFKSQMQKILVKKKMKISEKGYLELVKVYQRMLTSLSCANIEQAVREYWGTYRQKSKFEESFQEIRKFQNFLETII